MLQFFWKLLVRMKNPTCTIQAETLTRNVSFEDKVTIEKGCFIGADKIGRYTFIGMNSYVDKSTASIGRFCSIAMGAKIGMRNHPMEWVSTHPFTYNRKYGFVPQNVQIEGVNDRKTVIGNDVWIGTNVTILAGVTVGDGAVLGANSLVTKDVEPYSIVSGTPAKHLRHRFNDETVEKLLRLKWWEWNDEKLKQDLSLFREPEKFLSANS